jgi:hypothetical protein
MWEKELKIIKGLQINVTQKHVTKNLLLYKKSHNTLGSTQLSPLIKYQFSDCLTLGKKLPSCPSWYGKKINVGVLTISNPFQDHSINILSFQKHSLPLKSVNLFKNNLLPINKFCHF